MDDRGGALGRQRPHELVAQLVERRELAGLRGVPLLRPAAQLALDEAGRSAEVLEADGGRVDGVQVGEYVDERCSDRRPRLGTVRVPRRQRVAADVAEHALHHVEVDAQRPVRAAEMQDARHRHGGALERVQDAVLADHVVRGGQDVPERRAPEHHLAGVAGDPVREVGLAAGDQRDVALQPARVVQRLGEQRADDVGLGAGA